jgi:hypothetical protein
MEKKPAVALPEPPQPLSELIKPSEWFNIPPCLTQALLALSDHVTYTQRIQATLKDQITSATSQSQEEMKRDFRAAERRI